MDLSDALLLSLIASVSFILAFYGAAVGVILGHLRVPLLGYYLPTTAAGNATNLAISGLAAFTGTLGHLRGGRISWRVLLLMGVPSMCGAIVGAFILVKVNPTYAQMFIGGFLILSGYNLITTKPNENAPAKFHRWVHLTMEVLIGLGLGILAAITGLMLGTMRLPMMLRWLKIDPRVAVGSNMAIGFLTALVSCIALWGQGSETFHLAPLLGIGPPTVLGGYLGAKWTGKFNKETLTRLVGWTIVITGVGMLGFGGYKVMG